MTGRHECWPGISGKHIPGNPEVIVQNMPGASSVTAANYVWGVAKPDGLTILAPHNNVYLGQLSGQKEVQFDLPKFQWIGSLENDDMMIFGRSDASFKSIGDIVRAKEPPKCGSTGVGSSDYVMSKILEETIGAKVTHVTGYPGSSEIAIALERGEVAGYGALTIATYFGREPFLTWQQGQIQSLSRPKRPQTRAAVGRRADHLRADGRTRQPLQPSAASPRPCCREENGLALIWSHQERQRIESPFYAQPSTRSSKTLNFWLRRKNFAWTSPLCEANNSSRWGRKKS